jgi:hypothetical protein
MYVNINYISNAQSLYTSYVHTAIAIYTHEVKKYGILYDAIERVYIH